MEDCRIPNQALNWNLGSMNRKPGRPRKNWQDIIRNDLKDIGMSWDEASELEHTRSSWRQRVAQCVFGTGRTPVSGQFQRQNKSRTTEQKSTVTYHSKHDNLTKMQISKNEMNLLKCIKHFAGKTRRSSCRVSGRNKWEGGKCPREMSVSCARYIYCRVPLSHCIPSSSVTVHIGTHADRQADSRTNRQQGREAQNGHTHRTSCHDRSYA